MKTKKVLQGKREHRVFDIRLVKKIVKEIENGLPRREAVRIHGMSLRSLQLWLARYGSQEYQANKKRSYSPSQKRSILRAVESGCPPKRHR